MPIPKGGRGLKAPYETTHVRVPVPIQEPIQSFIDEWKQLKISGNESDTINPLTTLDASKKLTDKCDLDRAVKLAHNVLKQKKSARVSLERFLSEVYQEDITL